MNNIKNKLACAVPAELSGLSQDTMPDGLPGKYSQIRFPTKKEFITEVSAAT